MAEGKKSFVLYADLKPTIKKLVENDRINKTNNAGELFLHILEYVTDTNPEAVNFIVDVSFEPIKQQLKRDLIKFEEVKEKRSDAGKASAEARKLSKLKGKTTNSTSVKSVQQTSTNSTVSDNDSVNDNVIKKDTKVSIPTKPKLSDKERTTRFLNFFNNQILKHKGKEGKFSVLSKTDLNNLKKLKESYTDANDWINAFNAMYQSDWVQENNMVTPSHFLRNEMFQKYVNTEVRAPKKELYPLTPDVMHQAKYIPELRADLLRQGYTMAQIEGSEI